MIHLRLGKRKWSRGARSGEELGCSTTAIFFTAKKCRMTLWAGALSWWNSYDLPWPNSPPLQPSWWLPRLQKRVSVTIHLSLGKEKKSHWVRSGEEGGCNQHGDILLRSPSAPLLRSTRCHTRLQNRSPWWSTWAWGKEKNHTEEHLVKREVAPIRQYSSRRGNAGYSWRFEQVHCLINADMFAPPQKMWKKNTVVAES